MNGRWDRIKEVFLAASALPPEAQTAYVNETCSADAELREAVEELLHWGAAAPEFESPLRFKDLTGRTIGHYRVIEKLGKGGMGVVYKAEDTFLGRTVVLKFLAPEVTANPEFRERFLHEAKAAAAFDHPHICTLYGIEEFEGATFLVMAYIGGKTLKERIQSGPMPADEALRVAMETAQGLQEAHRKGIVHRDIKPSNILLSTEGRAVITDFGLALSDGEPRITQHGEWLGTPAYMAPEQIRGEKATPRSDIWALGVVLYEMIAGRLPFPDRSIPSLVLAIQEGSFERLSAACPGIPRGFDGTIGRLLAREEGERFPDADTTIRALLLLRDASPAARNQGLPESRKGFPRAVLRLGLILTALIFAVAVFWKVAPGPAPLASPEVVPLSSYSGMEDTPSFSPDGEQVAFAWRPEGARNSEICVKLLREEKQHCLTAHPLQDIAPSWSPDGHWIAFLRMLTPQTFGIYITSPLGGQERQLAQIKGREDLEILSRVAWTPDSSAIVFSDMSPETQPFRLWLLSVDTLQRRPLTSPPGNSGGDRSPAISPDGRSLAFVREGDIFGDLYVQKLLADFVPDGPPRQVTFDNRFLVGPAWNSNGSEILFAASDSISRSGLRIWRVSASGTPMPSPVDLIGDGSYSPAISADGRRLAFTRYQNDQNIWRIDRNTVDSPWQPPRKFSEISSTRDDGVPTVAPDGTRIAFVSNRAGGFDVWVSNRDGSNARQRTFSGGLSGTLAWSPDGSQIAFDRNIDGNWDVYLVAADAGQPRRLTMDATNETVDTWSRDGKSVYINSNRTPLQQIWRIPTEGGKPVQVTQQGGFFGMESPDGKYFYYTESQQTGPLRRLTIETGDEVKILDAILPLCFAVTEHGIFFIPPDSGTLERSDFNYLDFRTGRITSVAKSEAKVTESISLSPDGLTVLFAQRDQLGSDLMLVNNFR